MKVAFQVGAELDVMTPDELKRELDRRERLKTPIRLSDSATKTLDANGNGTVLLHTIPAGYRFRMYRVVIWSPSYSPASGYQSANAWAGLYAGPNANVNDLKDYAPSSPGGILIPAVTTYGFDASPEFQPNDRPSVIFTSGPASVQVIIGWEGDLFPEFSRDL
jgi:hypothetical protein